ncbi:hypothetical protein [Tritonibacter multivorans]|uniref:hypothetical protein n=1 Tax=Tritonibacter multivorans TaxID=928856 RepID=UPI00104137E6|nr:hypothetical protein [Tritonibacter multivorans]MDA7421228.1 hypothetical protein [Tritonibacter multivorans]
MSLSFSLRFRNTRTFFHNAGLLQKHQADIIEVFRSGKRICPSGIIPSRDVGSYGLTGCQSSPLDADVKVLCPDRMAAARKRFGFTATVPLEHAIFWSHCLQTAQGMSISFKKQIKSQAVDYRPFFADAEKYY